MELRDKRVTVTGGAGFLGSHVVRGVRQRGANIFVPRSRDYDLISGEEGPLGKRYNMRWSAAMVGDLHRILTRGGIFLYPAVIQMLQ